ncbi:MAG: hypothetical protein JSS24_06415, partial [Proteobacteria bacterium]|nr:hypothetical protein [Pseudomonadota bacterium]
MGATPAWLAAVEAMMNRELAQSPRAATLAHSLEGRSLRVSAGEILAVRAAIAGGRLMLAADDTRVEASGAVAPGVATQADGASSNAPPAVAPGVDAHIEGSPFALLALFNESAAHPGGAASVQIRGDAEVANRFRALFKLLRPDVEGQAARLIGELPAQALAR